MQGQDLRKERGLRAILADSSSTVMGRAWSDKRWDVPSSVAGLLVELAFALPTHEDDDADGTQNPCTDEPADTEAVPIIVERTVFIFRVVGSQGRQSCQEDEQAQGDLLHDGALAWRGVREGPPLAGPLRCYRGLRFPIPSYSTPHQGTQLTPGQKGWH